MATNYEFGEAFQRHSLAVLCRIPGGVLRYRSALDHTFYGSDVLRTISEVLYAHVDEHGKLPQQPTLTEEVREHASEEEFKSVSRTLDRLFKEDVSDAKAVLSKLIEFGRQQALINATLKAADKLDRGDRDLRPLFDEAALVGEDLLDIGVDYKGDVKSRLASYLDPSLQDADKIRTGIPHLDSMLDGGLGRGELGVFLAPPKRGKSTTLINVGFGALTSVMGYNIAHYSMEMNQDKVSGRYDDRLMGERVKFKKSDVARYAAGVDERVGRVVRGRLFVKDYPTRGATVSKIRSHLSLLSARGFHPDLIIVDYADIMKAERRMGEMRHEQAGIYEDLRQLAGECNAAMWTGSQASRGALEKDIITIEDFAEAFEKAAIVDVAIAFCQTNDERIQHRCRLFGAALRNQEDGRTVECEILRDRCRLRSIALYDVAGTQITVDGLDDKREDYAKPADNNAVRKKAAKRLKDKAGLTRKKTGKKVYRKTKKKTGKKTTARRRSDRVTHKVQLDEDDE
jgi:replicative DNA helicase